MSLAPALSPRFLPTTVEGDPAMSDGKPRVSISRRYGRPRTHVCPDPEAHHARIDVRHSGLGCRTRAGSAPPGRAPMAIDELREGPRPGRPRIRGPSPSSARSRRISPASGGRRARRPIFLKPIPGPPALAPARRGSARISLCRWCPSPENTSPGSAVAAHRIARCTRDPARGPKRRALTGSLTSTRRCSRLSPRGRRHPRGGQPPHRGRCARPSSSSMARARTTPTTLCLTRTSATLWYRVFCAWLNLTPPGA